jgi:glycosyltransferase involved in cell wall biosynthesis
MRSILIIGSVWPEPKSSAAGSHMMQLISVLLSRPFEIVFASPCSKTDKAVDLGNLGIKTVEIQLNHSSFDEFLSQLNPDIVVFDRFMIEEQFGWRVSETCPNAMRILNTEDLHCLRKGRHKALTDHQPFDNRYLFNTTAKREIASIYRSDLSLIISDYEMNLLEDQFKIDPSLMHYFPFLIESIPTNRIEKLAKFEERDHFITIGNFMHEPNFDAVQYLRSDIWPLIREQLPQTEMHVYGAYVSQKVQQLNDVNNGFIIKGFVEDVSQVMKSARVCLAPLRFGAGLKGKIVDAMINGTPCMTSKIGAEGLFGIHESNGFVVDDAKEFADKAVELFSKKPLWSKKQENGFKVINDRFSIVEHQEALLNRLEAVLKNLDEHRLQNFAGLMLHYHTLQSTKYMSRWIEEKNKVN